MRTPSLLANWFWFSIFGAGVLLGAIDCGSDEEATATAPAQDDGGSPPTEGGAPDAGGVLVGPYCTTWTQFRPDSPGAPAWAVVCMNQTSGEWEPLGNPAEEAIDCDGKGARNYGSAQVFVGPQNELHVGYEQCNGYDTHAFIVKKYADGSWKNVSPAAVNADPKTGALRSVYSQYGPTHFFIGGALHVFWTTFDAAFVSRLEGTTWTEKAVPECFRHPEALVVGDRGYVYCGEPKPLAWDVTGAETSSAGTIPFDPKVESSLHTTMTSFDQNLVMAFSSHPTSQQAWQDTVDTTHVAFRQGDGSWKITTQKIEDTPGHDAAKPFLFVSEGALHILFPDYSTDGVPKDPGRLAIRFRVKRWTGNEWTPVGAESPRIALSQRFEYTLDDKTVLVSAIAPGADHIVLAWRDGQFQQAGKVVHHFGDPSKLSTARPGAVVRFLR